MIGAWILATILFCGGIGIGVLVLSDAKGLSGWDAGSLSIGIISILVGVILSGLIIWWLYGTQVGERAQKTFHSQVKGDIERTVDVYDIEGDLIEHYQGEFDITYDENRVMFDDENGVRHQIFFKTGTVIVDEVEE